MDLVSSPPDQGMNVQDVDFGTGNQARLIAPTADANPADILQALGLPQPRPVVLVVGGAGSLDQSVKPRLTQLFSRGVVRAALKTDAILMDGGTASGVMGLLGAAVAARGHKGALLGVAPASKVTYPGGPAEGTVQDGAPLEPHHSHFVLAPGKSWGDETMWMMAMAAELIKGQAATETTPKAKSASVVVLVAGGKLDGVARNEVLQSVRRG